MMCSQSGFEFAGAFGCVSAQPLLCLVSVDGLTRLYALHAELHGRFTCKRTSSTA